MEPDFAAPAEPVYEFFESLNDGLVDLPTVKAHRGPIVFRQATAWDHVTDKIRRRRRSIRHRFRSWWWPARIRDLEARVRYFEKEYEDEEDIEGILIEQARLIRGTLGS